MEIQKIFSDQYDEERYYSVLMDEDELMLFSELQKEFGIISELYHSGLKRTSQKYAGRARKKIANKILNSIVRDDVSRTGAFRDMISADHVLNKGVRKNLYKKGNDLGATTVGINPGINGQGSSFTINKSYLPSKGLVDVELLEKYKHQIPGSKGALKKGKKLRKNLKTGRLRDNVVDHTVENGDELLAHEYGHIGNIKEGSALDRAISKIGKDLKTRQRVSQIASGDTQFIADSSPSIKDAIKTSLLGKAMIQEEKNASRRGLRYLKEAGATKEELKKAKKNLDRALDTYKQGSKELVKSHLYQKVQIPSRRTGERVREDVADAVKDYLSKR